MTPDGWLVTGIISTLTFAVGTMLPTVRLKSAVDVNAKDITNIKERCTEEQERFAQERTELMQGMKGLEAKLEDTRLCIDEKLEDIRKIVYALNGRKPT